jgi:mutator protein MutT
MRREISAGGVVFNKDGQVLLVSAGSLRDRSKLHWKFPKGHIEGEETSEEAALREVEEETSIQAEIISKLGDSKYTYILKDEKIFKIVIWFIMKEVSGKPKPQAGEIEEVKWVEAEEALKLLSFSIDKTLLKKALEIHGQ